MQGKFPTFNVLEFENFEEVQARDAYLFNVNPFDHKLKELIGYYQFKDKVPCGLTSCHTPHNKGYLAITETGIETNIGSHCGKTYFEADFDALRKTFEQRREINSRNQRLNEFLASASSLRQRVQEIWQRPTGGKWLHESLKEFLRVYPERIKREVRSRAFRGPVVVHARRRATARERQVAEEVDGNPNLKIVSVAVGQLRGLDAFMHDVQELLKTDVLGLIQELEECDPSIGASKRNEFVRRVADVEAKFETAEAAVAAGRKFFQPENLRLLQLLTTDDKAQAAVARIVWDYDKHAAEALSHGQHRRRFGKDAELIRAPAALVEHADEGPGG